VALPFCPVFCDKKSPGTILYPAFWHVKRKLLSTTARLLRLLRVFPFPLFRVAPPLCAASQIGAALDAPAFPPYGVYHRRITSSHFYLLLLPLFEYWTSDIVARNQIVVNLIYRILL
jgi:hypothetical protein